MKNLHALARLQRKSLALGLTAALAMGAGLVAEAAPPPVPAGSLLHGGADAGRLLPGLEKLRHADRRPHPAGTIHMVTNCEDSGAGSLREAIAVAVDGDVIDLTGLTCSTISLDTGKIEAPLRSLDIRGPGSDALLIDALGNDSAFYFSGKYQEDSQVSISGMTIANGYANGTGCLMASGNLSLEDVHVRDCVVNGSPGFGAGVTSAGNVLLRNSTITGNRSQGADNPAGGGVFAMKYLMGEGSTISNNTITGTEGAAGGGATAKGILLVDSVVSGNRAHAGTKIAQGGGLLAIGSYDLADRAEAVMALYRTRVNDNVAESVDDEAHGGGIRAGALFDNPSYGSVLLTLSTISGNVATGGCPSCVSTGGGGGAAGDMIAYYSTISDNEVGLADGSNGTTAGGGLVVWPDMGSIGVAQSTVSGNRAIAPAAGTGAGVGGGIAVPGESVTIIGSTITGNSASTFAGGVHPGPNTTSDVVSSIIAGNTATIGANVGIEGGGPATFDGGHNLIGEVAAAIVVPADTLDGDPRLLPLADNGGPTLTHALAPDSPAMDAGVDAGFDHDQRGPYYLRAYGAGVDIGAFELQPEDRIFDNGFDPGE